MSPEGNDQVGPIESSLLLMPEPKLTLDRIACSSVKAYREEGIEFMSRQAFDILNQKLLCALLISVVTDRCVSRVVLMEHIGNVRRCLN